MKDMAHFWRGFEFFIDTVVDDAIDSTFFDHFFLYFHRFMGDLTNFFYFPLTLVGDGRRHLVENFMETVLGKASDQKQPAKVNFLDNNSVYQKIKSFRKKMLLKAEATLNEYMGKYIYVNIWHDHDIDYRSKLTSAFPVKADDTRAASWMKKKLFEFFGQDISSESLLKDLGNLLILIEIFMTLFLLKILRCICLLRRNRIG